MNKLLILCILTVMLYFFFFYFPDNFFYSNNDNNNNNKNNNNQSILKIEDDSEKKEIQHNKLSNKRITSTEESVVSVDLTKGVFYSEENLFSETTNDLISNSYLELLNNVYKKLSLIMVFNLMGKQHNIIFNLELYKDDKMTNEFMLMLKSYFGNKVFNYEKEYGILFTGDYLNNNGSSNYNNNRSLTYVDSTLPSFIPANSICMVGIKDNNGLNIGSQFALNLYDITDQLIINKHKLLPFGKFTIDQKNEQLIIKYYNNKLNGNLLPNISYIIDVNNNNDNDNILL